MNEEENKKVAEQEQKTEQADAVRTDFIGVLEKLRNGDAVFELSQELEKVVAAVGETGKKGSLTLELNLEPQKGDSVTLCLLDNIKTKIPKKSKGGSIFFRTDKNMLQREDPRQMRLF
jgi:hypothetical protein